MRLLVIRHGESEADILKVHEGRSDFELTQKGRAQAQKMSDWVTANYTIQKIYSSTLKRAMQTAQELAATTGVEITPETDLMEFNNGLLAGLSEEEADLKYPKINDLPLHESVYQMESILEFRHRAEVMLSRIISENDKDAVIAVITHGGMIDQLYHAFLRLPPDSDIHFITGDTGIHEWQVTEQGRKILSANRLGHLDTLQP